MRRYFRVFLIVQSDVRLARLRQVTQYFAIVLDDNQRLLPGLKHPSIRMSFPVLLCIFRVRYDRALRIPAFLFSQCVLSKIFPVRPSHSVNKLKVFFRESRLQSIWFALQVDIFFVGVYLKDVNNYYFFSFPSICNIQ